MTDISSAAACRSCWLQPWWSFVWYREPAVTRCWWTGDFVVPNKRWLSFATSASLHPPQQSRGIVCMWQGRAGQGGQRAPSLDHMQRLFKSQKKNWYDWKSFLLFHFIYTVCILADEAKISSSTLKFQHSIYHSFFLQQSFVFLKTIPSVSWWVKITGAAFEVQLRVTC